MIVRNEAAVISRCLNSLRPLIDYWIIVDTGSSDGTKEIIRSTLSGIPGELHEHAWVDFSHNRNAALDLAMAHGDYVLLIDADEVFAKLEGFTWPPLDRVTYHLTIERDGFSWAMPKLVRSSSAVKYVGVTHECLIGESDPPGRIPGLSVLDMHDGGRSVDPDKYRKDAVMLERALIDDPHNTRYVFYLAQSYRDAGDTDLAIRHYLRRASMGDWIEEVWFSHYQAAALMERAGYAWHYALEEYLRALELCPDRAEPLYQIGRHYRLAGQIHAAYLFLHRAGSMKRPSSDRLFVSQWIYDSGIPQELAEVLKTSTHGVSYRTAAI